MRLVHADGGVVEIKWMWLPTFIGQHHHLLRDLGRDLNKKFAGKMLCDEEGLSVAHEFILDWLQQKFQIKGLREYLSAISNVEE